MIFVDRRTGSQWVEGWDASWRKLGGALALMGEGFADLACLFRVVCVFSLGLGSKFTRDVDQRPGENVANIYINGITDEWSHRILGRVYFSSC